MDESRKARRAMLSIGVNAVSAPVLAWLVSRYLSPDQQGVYYLLSSLLLLQVLFEMGINQCLINIVSHHLIDLRVSDGQITLTGVGGETAVTAVRIALAWYVTAIIGVVLATTAILFGTQGLLPREYVVALGLAIGTTLAVSVTLAVLDGLNLVLETATLRAVQAVVRTCGAATFLVYGRNAGAIVWATFLASIIVLLVAWAKGRLRWLKEDALWSIAGWRSIYGRFQSEVAQTWISNLFFFGLLQTACVASMGLSAAGRFGMTFSLMQGVRSIASAFVTPEIPRWGMEIGNSRRDLALLSWKRRTLQSICVVALGVVFLLGVSAIDFGRGPLLRLADGGTIAVLGFGAVLTQFSSNMGELVRCFKRDPAGPCALLCGGLLVASVYMLGSTATPIAVSIMYAFSMIPAGIVYAVHLKREFSGHGSMNQ